MLVAIDPGPTESAFVVYVGGIIKSHGKIANQHMLSACRDGQTGGERIEEVVIEQVASYGMPVGSEVFETVFWSGRFAEAAERNLCIVSRLPRMEVKMHLCHKTRGVNDSVIRQALIDKFGPGKEKAIGNKKSPGPCFGIKADCWQALALAVAWSERRT